MATRLTAKTVASVRMAPLRGARTPSPSRGEGKGAGDRTRVRHSELAAVFNHMAGVLATAGWSACLRWFTASQAGLPVSGERSQRL